MLSGVETRRESPFKKEFQKKLDIVSFFLHFNCFFQENLRIDKMKSDGILREKLVDLALKWQKEFGVSPQIVSSISEYDAAKLVGMKEKDYSEFMQKITAVHKGSDFVYKNVRYQIKANRPSGKPGSKVTNVPKAKNYEWDKLIWILYDEKYVMQEAWEWKMNEYKKCFQSRKRLSPKDYRNGKRIYPKK